VNGKNAQGPILNSVARLKIAESSQSRQISLCTGTLIQKQSQPGPKSCVISTAKHCFFVGEGSSERVSTSSLVQIEFTSNAGKVEHRFNASSYETFRPELIEVESKNDMFSDLALVYFDCTSTPELVPLPISFEAKKGEKVEFFGFGNTSDTDKVVLATSLQEANGVIEKLSDSNEGVIQAHVNQAQACSGDSGGPIIVAKNNEKVVTGALSSRAIKSRADLRCIMPTSFYANYKSAKDWILTRVPNARVFSQSGETSEVPASPDNPNPIPQPNPVNPNRPAPIGDEPNPKPPAQNDSCNNKMFAHRDTFVKLEDRDSSQITDKSNVCFLKAKENFFCAGNLKVHSGLVGNVKTTLTSAIPHCPKFTAGKTVYYFPKHY